MRILQVNTERTWRGGERQTLLTARELNRAGHWCGLVCRKGGLLFQKALTEKIAVFPIGSFGPWDPFAAMKLRSIANEHEADLIHAQTSHALNLASIVKMPVPLIASRRVDFSVRNAGKYNKCEAVIAISDAIRKVLVESGVRKALISVVPSGVDTRIEISEDRDAIRRTLWEEPVFIVGSVGHLANHKAFDVFLRSWPLVLREHPQARMVLVGEGEERERLEKIIADLNLADSVRLTGFQQFPHDYINAFDLYLQPSRTEGLGSTVIDALLLKKQVIVTGAGGLPEVVEHGKFGQIVEPENHQILAGAISSAISGEIVFDAEAAADWAKTRFGVGNMVRSTIDIYQKVLSAK